MKDKCCRSAPRCAGCPVLAIAAARRRATLDEQSRLIADVLGGQVRTELPPSIQQALAQLDEARRPVPA